MKRETVLSENTYKKAMKELEKEWKKEICELALSMGAKKKQAKELAKNTLCPVYFYPGGYANFLELWQEKVDKLEKPIYGYKDLDEEEERTYTFDKEDVKSFLKGYEIHFNGNAYYFCPPTYEESWADWMRERILCICPELNKEVC